MNQHGLCTVAKRDFLSGVHQPGDRYMLALFDANAGLSPATATYDQKGEVEGKSYRPGGMQLRNPKIWMDDNSAYLTFDSVRWVNSTITAHAALIYNASKGNKAIAVLDFGGAYTSTVGDFFLNIPADCICFV